MVSRLTGYPVQPNKAIVGRNAFAHESGIHQDGVLKHRQTYEIMDATTIGLEGNDLVLGKHSGRHALKSALAELGFDVDGQALNTAFKRFKELADRKKQVTAMDLEALVTDELRDAAALLHARVVRRRRLQPPPAARARRDPHARTASEALGDFTGDGPVDAIFRAINAATKREARLREFRIDAVTGGQDALGEASVVLELAGQSAAGPGRLDRHHRGRGAGLRARALQRRAQGARGRGGARAGGRAHGRAVAAEPRRPAESTCSDRAHVDRPVRARLTVLLRRPVYVITYARMTSAPSRSARA